MRPTIPRFFSQQTDRWKRLLQYGLPATLAALLLVFCSNANVPTTLDHAPASSLDLQIEVDDQYATTSGVTIKASFSQSPTQPIILSGKQRFECDGASFPQTVQPQVSVPRQPPGGAYSCLYTDDQGKQTSLSIAVPQGTFAITSPTAGATVPIPVSPRPLNTPTTNAGLPRASPTVASPQPIPPANSLTIQYILPILSSQISVFINGEATCGNYNSCGVVYGSTSSSRDGAYTLSDFSTADGQGFDQFVPGPGSITLSQVTHGFYPSGGFSYLTVLYRDTLTIPVTWTR